MGFPFLSPLSSSPEPSAGLPDGMRDPHGSWSSGRGEALGRWGSGVYTEGTGGNGQECGASGSITTLGQHAGSLGQGSSPGAGGG